MRRKTLQQDIARALGVSPAMVSRLKKRGMPVHSSAAAAEWRRQNLDPALVKSVRLRLHGVMPDPVEVARNLAALTAGDPARWLDSLRIAMREIPDDRRDELEIEVAAWDALLAPAEPFLKLCVEQTAAGVQTPERCDADDEEVGMLLYRVACGEIVLGPPA